MEHLQGCERLEIPKGIHGDFLDLVVAQVPIEKDREKRIEADDKGRQYQIGIGSF